MRDLDLEFARWYKWFFRHDDTGLPCLKCSYEKIIGCSNSRGIGCADFLKYLKKDEGSHAPVACDKRKRGNLDPQMDGGIGLRKKL